jgi:hypothetical protein
MSGSTPQAEDPGGPSLSPGPGTYPGPGDGGHAGSGMQPDLAQGPATEPGHAPRPHNRTEPGPDTAPGQQTTIDPDTAPGHQATAAPDTAPGLGATPGYRLQPSPGTPGYGTTPGLETQPGYAPQPRYGYGPPGPGSTYPVPPARKRRPIWLGIIAGFMILAAVIAGVSVYLLNKPQKWTLTAPQTLVGISPDTSPTDQLRFNALIARFKSDLTSLPHYGSLKSTVSGIYRQSQRHSVGFIGFNGAFNVRVALKTGAGLTVTKVNPGPHGGTAECGTDGTNTVCQWSTGTTIGIVVAIPTSLGAGQEKRRDVHSLMLKIRDSVERPAH